MKLGGVEYTFRVSLASVRRMKAGGVDPTPDAALTEANARLLSAQQAFGSEPASGATVEQLESDLQSAKEAVTLLTPNKSIVEVCNELAVMISACAYLPQPDGTLKYAGLTVEQVEEALDMADIVPLQMALSEAAKKVTAGDKSPVLQPAA